MKETNHHYIRSARQLPRTLLACTALALLYVILGLALPPNTPTVTAYNLSITEYHILVLLISVPLIAVWYAAFYGYARLQEYVTIVGTAPDGRPLNKIASGLKVLAWGLPLSSIISSLGGGIVHSHANLAAVSFIIIHYLSLLISLIAFAYISTGSRGLMDLTKTYPTLSAVRWLLVVLTIIGVIFSYFTINAAHLPSPNPYFMPIGWVLFTLLVPYLFAWFMGLLAAYEIYLYSRRAKGLLYRRALAYLALGILITIIISIVFQYIASDTMHLRKITFSWLFLGIYVLFVVYAAGFVLISAGVKKLRKIEEV